MNKYTLDIQKEVEKESVINVKKSKFISKVFYVTNSKDAEKIYKDVKEKYSDAKHVIYAYRLENVAKYSDDKEPQGTAGKPIYALLEKEDLINVMVVVIRYFGGVLLGTGLLTRTYLLSAKEAINMYDKKKYMEYIEIKISFEYNEENIIQKLLLATNVNILEVKRDKKVQMLLNVPKEKKDTFSKYMV